MAKDTEIGKIVVKAVPNRVKHVIKSVVIRSINIREKKN